MKVFTGGVHCKQGAANNMWAKKDGIILNQEAFDAFSKERNGRKSHSVGSLDI